MRRRTSGLDGGKPRTAPAGRRGGVRRWLLIGSVFAGLSLAQATGAEHPVLHSQQTAFGTFWHQAAGQTFDRQLALWHTLIEAPQQAL